MAQSGLADYVIDVLSALGPVAPRRMFGGTGLYLDGRMFAMVLNDTLYLCTDDEMRGALIAEGAAPFRYTARGREIEVKRFYEAPGSVLDDEEALNGWARKAVAAAAVPAAKARAKKRAPTRSG